MIDRSSSVGKVVVAALAAVAVLGPGPEARTGAQDAPVAGVNNPIPVWGLAFSPDGTLLAAAGGVRAEGGVLAVWNTDAWSPRHVLREERAVTCAAFSPDGTRLLAGRQDAQVLLVDVADGRVVHRWPTDQQAVNGVMWTPDGARVLTAGSDGTIRVWDAVSHELLRTLDTWAVDGLPNPRGQTPPADGQKQERFIWDLAVSGDGAALLSGGWGDTTRLWDLRQGTQVMKFAATDTHVQGVAFTSDGKNFISNGIGMRGGIYVRETESGLERAIIRYGGRDVAIHPRGDLLAATVSQEVRVFRLNLALPTDAELERYMEIIARFEDDDAAVREAASAEVLRIGLPMEPLLYESLRAPGAETRMRSRRLWNQVRSPEPVAVLGGHRGEPRQVTFSPDGRLIATASTGGDVRVWDAEGFTMLRELAVE